jgi:hypothetical protein
MSNELQPFGMMFALRDKDGKPIQFHRHMCQCRSDGKGITEFAIPIPDLPPDIETLYVVVKGLPPGTGLIGSNQDEFNQLGEDDET